MTQHETDCFALAGCVCQTQRQPQLQDSSKLLVWNLYWNFHANTQRDQRNQIIMIQKQQKMIQQKQLQCLSIESCPKKQQKRK